MGSKISINHYTYSLSPYFSNIHCRAKDSSNLTTTQTLQISYKGETYNVPHKYLFKKTLQLNIYTYSKNLIDSELPTLEASLKYSAPYLADVYIIDGETQQS
ncbi:MAG: hypothetical protein NPIRA02_14720 [Nitrospirales bacterium]|nr:MAG: hypothetical protein NPIRA02_14720 [Nitrospirales bacterium]